VPSEPAVKRAVAFFDGQNLFYAAKASFGRAVPDYSPHDLAQAVCDKQGWRLEAVRFYTGIPDPAANALWHRFWTRKLAVMGTRNILCYTRPLRYRNQTIPLPNGRFTSALVGQEKGIDVRIALDVVAFARRQALDVALVFSQDQDLAEVAEEVRSIAHDQGRWIKMASAFPSSPTSPNRRGINRTDWIPIDRATYEACVDPTDYLTP